MVQWKKEVSLLTALMVLLAAVILPAQAKAVSTSSSLIVLYLDNKQAFVNSEQMELESPATIIKDKTFVPAKFLGDSFGFPVVWDDAARTITMQPPGYKIVLSSDLKKAYINGEEVPFDTVAAIKNGKLLVKLTWVADYMGAKYTYYGDSRKVEIVHVPNPGGIYDPGKNNSNPVAKFTTHKEKYRLGETIKYIDLSYDPDAEGLPKFEWTGKKDAFFKAGTYPVSLKVSDRNGNVSKVFTKNIVVEDVPYLSEAEYPVYHQSIGSFYKLDWSTLTSYFYNLPQLTKDVTNVTGRKLLVSDSPETFTEPGILYQDTVGGKSRLYVDHINGTDKKMTFAILATNTTDKPITVKTTNKGEVWPSVYANLIGSEASVDFLLGNTYNEKMTIPPKDTLVYRQLPDFYPGYGVNLFYDLETDGDVQFSFVATEELSAETLSQSKHLAFNGHVRGTFDVSEIKWDIDGTSFTKPSRLIIGDGKTDPFVDGYDVMRKENVKNGGNYGVVYKIHADKPRKMAIMLLARGGVFKGPIKINGEIQSIPYSGVITAFDGMQILHRTTGNEKSLDIEFTPPAGSAFPVDLIFYPLEDLD
ncbi:copper amine oxidase N-terminal domain-containing protein [Paenibacillus lutrae]|uniref:Copper amine oxidase N-terminal domain-containing protein n=1 Tax=Paenibacillus lutrae TaxID=2078573 RepID=A0A7X3K0K0_9BACL|nr:copper amine oxidase N-terminal domain-containing protein [Paenibacillus lutrae]MVP01253.1 copper amine oxidase N-terminal domain-containing protein [Paenibacillus lutrae]